MDEPSVIDPQAGSVSPAPVDDVSSANISPVAEAIPDTATMTIDPSTTSAAVTQSKPPPERSADIARAVALGEKRAAEEKARQAGRMEKKGERFRQSEASVRAGAEEKEEKLRERKAFRTERHQRELALAADKRRRDEEEKRKADEAARQGAAKTKRDAYMRDIRITAEAKGAIEHKRNALKAEYLSDCRRAEFDHRTAVETAERIHLRRTQEIDRQAHEERNTLETDLRQKLYQLEGWKRMRMQTQDSDIDRQAGALRMIRNLHEAQQKREELRALKYRMMKKLEDEWKERKTALEQEMARKRTASGQKAREMNNEAENDRKSAIRTADLARNHRLEELASHYNVQKKPLRAGA